jgi:hypothetical protein
MESRFDRNNQIKSPKNVALHFRENDTPHLIKSMTYATLTRSNCRRWAWRSGGLPAARRGLFRFCGQVIMSSWARVGFSPADQTNVSGAASVGIEPSPIWEEAEAPEAAMAR